ncbi:LAQU0S16e01772g1_1 [Lachancea quebecensis]|uniref:Exonuclease V, mitochondrial n=1 Tax=Lachancea quebecensis TaxID=1654605 RepID=A0A0P1KWR9_9SACH|nr:LAQU0S16e01772g1_1 [Lachancea quebecensis]
MTLKRLSLLTRNVHLPNKITYNPVKSNGSLTPTDEELEIINALPPFQQGSQLLNQSVTKAKRSYLETKLPKVQKLFKSSSDPAYLAYDFPPGLSNPYVDAHARPVIDPVTGDTKYRGTPRLSVTKLLTKRWCELRETYDIYSRIPIFEHNQVKQGRREHQRLEEEVHAPLVNIEEFEANFEVDIPDDPFHSLVEDWYLSIVRLVTLFQKGHAREILCHGYLGSQTGNFVRGTARDDDDVLVSGIIDHLILKQRNVEKPIPSSLNQTLSESIDVDLAQLLNSLPYLVERARKDFEIVVSDVKTRSTKTIPRQQTVVEASKMQVMYYRFLLEDLGKDAATTYQNLLINAQRRGFNVDQPINPAKIINLLEIDPMIRSDMERLQKGEPLGFKPFDNEAQLYTSHPTYNLEELDEKITDLRTRQKYEALFTKWSTPVTLRYFAARLALMYANLGPLLSQNLMIEYYCDNFNFHNVLFTFDAKELERQSYDSARFWFGKRAIEPIKPNMKNLQTYCKYCDYESVCLWRKEGRQTCKSLGQELVRLHYEDNPDTSARE